MKQPKRLFFDIESSPNIGLFWSAGYKQRIDYDNIITERAIICICYKWQGDKKVYGLQWDAKQNDKAMLQKFIEILNDADQIVGHNGDKFDLPWIRTRCIFHGLPMFPNYDTIDTLKHARSKFRFNSNRLDYIARYLGIGKKIETSFGLWKDVLLKKDKLALEQMVDYCKGDVELLEEVYLKMEGFMPHKIHHGLSGGEKMGSCPHCGGYEFEFNRRRYSAAGMEKVQLQCKSCFKHHTISKTRYENSYK